MAELNDAFSYMLIVIAVSSLIGALILRLAAKWVALVEVPYFRAYFTLVIAAVISVAIELPVGYVAALLGADELVVGILGLALVPVHYLVQTLVIRWRLELTFSESLLVGLVMIGITIVLALIIVGILVGFLLITHHPIPTLNH